jgi:NitT/TauT family transport system substrate-binding protein
MAVFAAVALSAVALTGCGNEGTPDTNTTGAGADLLPIEVGVAPSSSSVSLRLGVREGFFEEEGLDVTIGDTASGANALSPILNGQQQFGLGGISPTVTAISAGVPVIIASGSVTDRQTDNGAVYQTIVSPDSGIERFRDLEGKVVAVYSVACCWEFWIREAIEKDGGDGSKVEVTQLPFADQVTALKAGNVDAISTLQPYATQLRDEGFIDIGDSPAAAFDNPESGNTIYYTSTTFLQENPDALEKWHRALQKSSDYANENPDEVIKMYVELTGGDPDLLARAPLPVYTAEADVATILLEAGFLVKYGVIDKAPSESQLIAE